MYWNFDKEYKIQEFLTFLTPVAIVVEDIATREKNKLNHIQIALGRLPDCSGHIIVWNQ